MELSKELLRILVCPITNQKLLYDRENRQLVSHTIGLGFPIVDGIPMMLKDMARPVSSELIKKLLKEQEVLETEKA
jgi:hypothetical protein